MKIIRNSIYMIRGDTESITVSLRDNGVEIPFEVGDTLYMTVKESVDVVEKQFQIVVKDFNEGKAVIEIDPDDTKEMEFGNYVYDIQLTTSDGNVTTIIPPNRFVLQGEVTYE